MSVPAWNVNLPQELFVAGYGQSPPAVTIKSEMDAGPAKYGGGSPLECHLYPAR